MLPGFPGGIPLVGYGGEYMSFQVMLQQLTTGFGQTLLIFFLTLLFSLHLAWLYILDV